MRNFAWLAVLCASFGSLSGVARGGEKPAVSFQAAATDHYNRGRFGQKIDMVVIHTVEGSQRSCVNTFRGAERRVSAHYVVGKDGSIVQCVDDANTAWHAGSVNEHSVGIEHEGFAAKPETWSDAIYASSAKLTRWLCDTYKIPIDRQHIVGHMDLKDSPHGDPGHHFDWDRYMRLVRGETNSVLPASPAGGTPQANPDARYKTSWLGDV